MNLMIATSGLLVVAVLAALRRYVPAFAISCSLTVWALLGAFGFLGKF